MRYLDKFLKWLGFAMLLAPFVWYVACQFDESLDLEVQATLTAVAQAPAPEQENGYYALLGMHAPAEVADIHAYGRDQLDRYHRVLVADPEMSEEYRFPEPALDFRGDKALLCSPRTSACLPRAVLSADALNHALEMNKALLARYHALYRYPRFVETARVHRTAPVPKYPSKAHEFVLATIAGDVTRGRTTAALEALSADTRHWRIVLADTRTLVTKMVAIAYLIGNYHLLSEILAAGPLDPANATQAQAMLTELTASERNMTEVLRWEFAAYDSADTIKRSIVEGLQGPNKDNAVRSLLARLGAPLVQVNATRNMVYRDYMTVAALAAAPAREFDARRAALAAEHAVKFHWHFLYNPLGKMVYLFGEPVWLPYVARVHDLDGYIRLVRLQLALNQAKTTPTDVPAFLARSTPGNTDPYTGKPVTWDPETRTLSFRARGSRPKESPMLAVQLGRY